MHESDPSERADIVFKIGTCSFRDIHIAVAKKRSADLLTKRTRTLGHYHTEPYYKADAPPEVNNVRTLRQTSATQWKSAP